MKFKRVLKEDMKDINEINSRDKIIGEIASYVFQKMKEISHKDPRQKSGYNGSIIISHPLYSSPEYMWDIRKGQSYGEEEDRSNRIDISFYSEITYTGSSYADPRLAYQNTSATMYRTRKAKDYGIFDITAVPLEKIHKWVDKNIKKIITLQSGSYKK